MSLNKPILSEKVHYSGPSAGYNHGYGGGHVYSASGHSGYGYHDHSGHGSGHGHSYHQKGNEKKSIALSALTLLAFLFFLHILQNCLEEQEQTTNTTTVIVMARNQQPQSYGTDLRKRKGQSNRRKGETAQTEEPEAVEELDEDYQESSEFLEKKAAAKSSIRRRHWDDKLSKGEKNEDSKVVKIKTFSKYDKIDFD